MLKQSTTGLAVVLVVILGSVPSGVAAQMTQAAMARALAQFGEPGARTLLTNFPPLPRPER